MYMVTVDSIAKSFKNVTALGNLSFNVERGIIYGLIGPDGAGKTTFMRIAACLLLQDYGIITIDGFDTVKHASDVKRIIGYMPQRFSLYPDLSVCENLSFFADLFGVPKKERRERIDQLIKFSRLGSFLGLRAENLSGGMKQKLALSCTLIHTPEVLFLDEPTIGVDPVSRREFWDLLSRIKNTGTTIVVSTPYMDEAEKCNRVGFIMNGALIAEGSPDEFPEKYSKELIAVRGADLVKRSRKLTFPDVVLNVTTFGDRLHLTVEDARAAAPVVRTFLEKYQISGVSIEQVAPSMEDVFVEHMKNAQ